MRRRKRADSRLAPRQAFAKHLANPSRRRGRSPFRRRNPREEQRSFAHQVAQWRQGRSDSHYRRRSVPAPVSRGKRGNCHRTRQGRGPPRLRGTVRRPGGGIAPARPGGGRGGDPRLQDPPFRPRSLGRTSPGGLLPQGSEPSLRELARPRRRSSRRCQGGS